MIQQYFQFLICVVLGIVITLQIFQYYSKFNKNVEYEMKSNNNNNNNNKNFGSSYQTNNNDNDKSYQIVNQSDSTDYFKRIENILSTNIWTPDPIDEIDENNNGMIYIFNNNYI